MVYTNLCEIRLIIRVSGLDKRLNEFFRIKLRGYHSENKPAHATLIGIFEDERSVKHLF